MVSNVEIVNGNLVITFNSDAGKQPISIPLTDIFNPANYYTTAQTQSYVSGFTYDKATIDQKVASGGTFDPDLYYDKTATDALLAAKADTATTYTKTEVDTALGNKADTSAVTAVANDVQTVSGQVATKVATSDFNTYTAATATALSGKQDALEYYTEDKENKEAVITVEDTDFTSTATFNSTTIDLNVESEDSDVHYNGYATVGDAGIQMGYDKSTGSDETDAHSNLNVEDGIISAEVYANEETTTVEITPTGVTINDEAVATEAYVDAATSGKADTSAVTAVNDALTAHTANTNVHVTSAEKAEWDGKAEVVELTQAQYDALVTKDPDVLYVITDATEGDLSDYYTKTETNNLLNAKQATLVSGTNIKTINNESILGSGNINIQGGGGVTVDPSLDSGSTNPVANSAITNAITAHTADTTVHVTAGNKTSWNNAASNAYTAISALGGLKLERISQADYDELVNDGMTDPDTLYIIDNTLNLLG